MSCILLVFHANVIWNIDSYPGANQNELDCPEWGGAFAIPLQNYVPPTNVVHRL